MKGARLYKKALELARTHPKSKQQCAVLLNEASQLGHMGAKYALASWYLHGVYFKKNLPLAVRLLKEAACARNASACYDLAVCYEQGEGVRISYRRAFSHYKTAASLGDRQAVAETAR